MPEHTSLHKKLLKAQKFEITEHCIYEKLSSQASGQDQEVLASIARNELEHYYLWKSFTGKDVAPSSFKVLFFFFLARFLGLNFSLRLLEKNEKSTHNFYEELSQSYPEVTALLEEKEEHELKLLGLINQKELQFMGSVVLGLNDALVELTGALTGLTFALQNSLLVACVAGITGLSAALSMSASEYLSTREEGIKNPFQASAFTGITYILTVLLLVSPYLWLKNPTFCLLTSLSLALIIIMLFSFYISIAKNEPFLRRFKGMAVVSLSVAFLNFIIGTFARRWLPGLP